MSALDFDLRFWITRYLAGEISIAEFRRWFLPVAWQAGEPGSSGSADVRRVELRLAEWANGHWTELDLQRLLAGTLRSTSGWIVECSRIVAPSASWDAVRAPLSGTDSLAEVA